MEVTGTIVQGAGALTKGEDRIEAEIFPITINVITAINKISPGNTLTDAQQRGLHAIFATKLATSNEPAGENVETSEDREPEE